MKRQAKYFRKGTVIRGPEGDQNFHSIALAKKESHRIQKAEGGLGSMNFRGNSENDVTRSNCREMSFVREYLRNGCTLKVNILLSRQGKTKGWSL